MTTPTLDEAMQIELLLEEANVFGLRNEVKNTAEKFMKEDKELNILDAYFMAYSEWIK
jgi:hypothetical protein